MDRLTPELAKYLITLRARQQQRMLRDFRWLMLVNTVLVAGVTLLAGYFLWALMLDGIAFGLWLILWKSNRLERMINGETQKAAANFSTTDWGAGPAPWE